MAVEEKRYTERQAADIIGCHKLTLRRWRRLGLISYQRHGARGVRYWQSHINEYLQRQVVRCQQMRNDSSSATSGSASEKIHPSGARPGSMGRRVKPEDVQRAMSILSKPGSRSLPTS